MAGVSRRLSFGCRDSLRSIANGGGRKFPDAVAMTSLTGGRPFPLETSATMPLLRPLRLALAAATVFTLQSTATAGFDEAVAAHKARDYDTALREARQAAEAGDARGSWLLGFMHDTGQGATVDKAEAVRWYGKAAEGGVARAFEPLARMHASGEGVAKDADKALDYARRGDRLGDPGSSHFVYVALIAGPLRWLDAAGKPDPARYLALAARPVAERTLDTEAHDALYRAAEKRYPPALFSLALMAGATVGEGNRERMLAALGKLPVWSHPGLKRYHQVALVQKRLGQTLTTPQLFLDAQLPQAVAAMIATCGIRDPKETPNTPLPELVKTTVSRPLTDAVWLPSSVPGYEHAFLVSGSWEERWTYRGCDRTADVTIEFTADGMGGATFASKQEAKAAAASPDRP